MGDDRAMDDDRTVLPLPGAPESIELRHLRAFVAVAKELNFARAAARLYLSSPALSRQIRVLERLVGADLLRRSTHHVELTLAGEALLDRARGVLADVDEAVARTRAVGGELSGRMARLWAPTADAGLDVTALRRAGEALHGQFAPPPEVQVRAANAGGVPALLVGTDLDRPADLLYLHGGGYVSGSAFGYRPLVGAGSTVAGCSTIWPSRSPMWTPRLPSTSRSSRRSMCASSCAFPVRRGRWSGSAVPTGSLTCGSGPWWIRGGGRCILR